MNVDIEDMTQERKNENTSNPDIIKQEGEEYIHSLEMSVQILRQELEHLRSQLRPDKSAHTKHDSSQVQQSLSSFLSCTSDKEVLEKLHEHLSEKFSIIESNIFFYTSEHILSAVSEAETSSTLIRHIKHLEEEGVIDWAIDQKKRLDNPEFKRD